MKPEDKLKSIAFYSKALSTSIAFLCPFHERYKYQIVSIAFTLLLFSVVAHYLSEYKSK